MPKPKLWQNIILEKIRDEMNANNNYVSYVSFLSVKLGPKAKVDGDFAKARIGKMFDIYLKPGQLAIHMNSQIDIPLPGFDDPAFPLEKIKALVKQMITSAQAIHYETWKQKELLKTQLLEMSNNMVIQNRFGVQKAQSVSESYGVGL
jgi:hypothetical protein